MVTIVPNQTPEEFAQLRSAAIDTARKVMIKQREGVAALARANAEVDALSEKQAHSLSLIRSTFDASPDGIVAFDLYGRITHFNQNFAKLWDLDVGLLQHAHISEIAQHCIAQVCDPNALRGPDWESEEEFSDEINRKDGRIYERYVSPQLLDGRHYGVVVQWRDVTKRRRADALNMRLSRILERSQNEIYLFDKETLAISYANFGAVNNLGFDLATLRTMTPVDIAPEFDEVQFRNMIAPLLNGQKEQLIFDTVHKRSNGSLYHVQVHLELDADLVDPQFLALTLDITGRKQSETLIWEQANFDKLTKLPNRAMLHDRMSHAVLKAKRSGGKVAILFLDLDKFKEVNDTYGHETGDLLLVQATQRILTCVRESDTVARIGGDEFVVLLTELHDAIRADQASQCLLATLRKPFFLNGKEADISASIGISIFPEDASDEQGLLKCADQAMYVSKSKGRDQYVFFTTEIEARSRRRMHVLSCLRHALRDKELYLNFQSIFDIKTGLCSKAEALLRWNSPELGAVSPVEFIPLAEESGLIVEIGEWVFDEVTRCVKHYRDTLHVEIQIAVNKSPVQFVRESGVSRKWADKLQELGLPGHCISVEITEGLLMEASAEVQSTLFAYRNAGIEVSIDDFGTGYSSLAYLRHFDIDYLKIDQSFISKLLPESNDLILTQAIIAMAHALGLKVVAEGVETEEQLSLLRSSGCDYVQGYLLSHPINAENFETILLDHGVPLG